MVFAPKHILVPVALGPDEDLNLAEYAVLSACDIALKFSSALTLLHLIPPITPSGSAGVDFSGRIYQSFLEVIKARFVRDRIKLTELEELAKKQGLTVEGRMIDTLESIPKVIVTTANELNADLIVIGSHGRHGLSKLLYGSVTQSVLEEALIPVLCLHQVSESKK